MPPELKESLQNKAIKIWKMALAQRQAAETTTTVAEVTTTQNKAMEMLLSGIDGHAVVPVEVPTTTTTTTTTTTEATTTTTTTTTPDAALVQQQIDLHKSVMAKLTDGMGKDDLVDDKKKLLLQKPRPP